MKNKLWKKKFCISSKDTKSLNSWFLFIIPNLKILEMLDAYGKIIKPGVYVKYYS